MRALTSFTATLATESGDKLTRFGPLSSQCRARNVKILRRPWNEELFRTLEGFPDLSHDDEVDACSGALEMPNRQMNRCGIYELMRRQAQALEVPRKPQPVKTVWAIGSMEWQAEQEKAPRTAESAPAPLSLAGDPEARRDN
jgi:hypothetical protein